MKRQALVKHLVWLAGASSVVRLGACTGDAAKEFRTIVVPNVQAGVLSILTGLVDGTFAVIDPDHPVEEGS